MNWQAISFDWNQVRAFLATAEEGSLSRAARALGLTQPTLGRQVAALEAALGVSLFERLGRRLVLTEAGRGLLDHARAMGEAAGGLSLSACGRAQAIEGRVCISASDVMAAYMLPPVLKKLRVIAPGIEVEVIASNAISDLRRREADIAIRHVRPSEPELIARLIRESTAYLYAAPAYLAQHGHPRSGTDLAHATFIGLSRPEQMMAVLQPLGLMLERQNFRLISTHSGLVGWELVKHGLGIGPMVEEIAALSPEVEAVLPQEVVIRVPTWLTTHRELHTSRRIRLVYDLLARELAARPSRP